MKHSQILVVNSLPIIREGLVAVFRESLADSIITGSGSFPEALALIAKKPVDLVVSTFRVQGDTALSLPKKRPSTRSTRPACCTLCCRQWRMEALLHGARALLFLSRERAPPRIRQSRTCHRREQSFTHS